ncbi:MAG: hypothetical protein ACRCUT_09985, partial [Spirochaetota bacterium]
MKRKDEKAGPSFEIEAGLFREGYRLIAGADEAGRGSLAGPLTVGLAIYDASFFDSPVPESLRMVDDSKKLTAAKRNTARGIISAHALLVLHEHVPYDLVDRLNPNRATCYALEKLFERAQIKPDIIM